MCIVDTAVMCKGVSFNVVKSNDLLDSGCTQFLFRGHVDQSCKSVECYFTFCVNLRVFGLELSNCYHMGIAWAGEFVDSIYSKAHEGLHYAGHEGGEVVRGWFMQRECFVNRE